jgi:crotonobetainyl-CoA:carnitine CoA-transferase CaiB-like acyl-CoA transferase
MLEGLKVLEIASVAAGPVAAAMLAEWGAEVIKIEPLEGERARSTPATLGIADAFDPDFDLHNRGKRDLALDLSKPESREIIDELVRRSDVFITNILPGKQVQRGLDWARLIAINPKLIHASISGHGSSGPSANLPAHDHTAFWAASGMAYLMTPKGDEPISIRRALGDRVTGLSLVAGVLAAYIEAQRTGRGKVVETSLLRAGIFAIGTDLATQLSRGRVGRSRPRAESVNPLYSFFPTKDDRWIAAHLGSMATLAALGRPDLAEDARFADPAARRANATELTAVLDEVFRQHTLAEWCERLKGAGFSWAPAQSPAEVVDDPQAIAAGAFADVPSASGEGSHRSVAMPAGFRSLEGEAEGHPKGAAPSIGEHTDQILAELGYSVSAISNLKADGVAR